MAKVFNLDFNKGITGFPGQVALSYIFNMTGSAEGYGMYPINISLWNQEFYNISVDATYDSLFYGDKILNNNISDNNLSYASMFFGVQYYFSEDLTSLSFKLSLGCVGIIGDYNFSTISYDEQTLLNVLPEQAGDVDGIDALRIRFTVATPGSYTLIYPHSIFRLVSPPNTINDLVELSDNYILKDGDYTADLPGYIFITNKEIYKYILGSSTEPELINSDASFIDLSGISYGDAQLTSTYFVATGLDKSDNQYKILIKDTISDSTLFYGSINGIENAEIYRVYFRAFFNQGGVYTAGFFFAVNDGVYLLSVDSTSPWTSATIIDSSNFVKITAGTLNVTDIGLSFNGGYQTTSGLVQFAYSFCTDDGFYMARVNIQNLVNHQSSVIAAGNSFTSIDGQIYSVSNTAGTYDVVAGTNNSLFHYIGTRDGPTFSGNVAELNDGNLLWNDIFGFRNSTAPPSSFKFTIGASASNGFIQLKNPEDYPIDDLIGIDQTIFLKFDIRISDFIKYSHNIYYGLLSLKGSGIADQTCLLFNYNSDNNSTYAGNIGSNISSDRFWIASNYFILNNNLTKNYFYYLTIDKLDLYGITDANNNNGGEFQTTEAGDIVDLIIERSIFYILGNRAIEVWQNNGATGFPYRKQPYLTGKFHNFPLLDINLPSEARYTSLNDRFIAPVLDNDEARFEIVSMSKGSIIPFEFNHNGVIQAINYFLGGYIEDLYINTFKTAGEQYLYLSLIRYDDFNEVYYNVAALLVNQKGQIFYQEYDTTILNYYKFVSSTGDSAALVNLSVDENTRLLSNITATYKPYLPNTLFVTDSSFPYVCCSQLIRPLAEELGVNKLIIQYSFLTNDTDNIPPDSQYKIEFSIGDGIDNWETVTTANYNILKRQIVVNITKNYPALMVRINSNIPIIILNGILTYEEMGVK